MTFNELWGQTKFTFININIFYLLKFSGQYFGPGTGAIPKKKLLAVPARKLSGNKLTPEFIMSGGNGNSSGGKLTKLVELQAQEAKVEK